MRFALQTLLSSNYKRKKHNKKTFIDEIIAVPYGPSDSSLVTEICVTRVIA